MDSLLLWRVPRRPIYKEMPPEPLPIHLTGVQGGFIFFFLGQTSTPPGRKSGRPASNGQ